MRHAWPVLALLLLAAPALAVPVTVLDDPSGDVQASSVAGAGPGTGATYASDVADLVSLAIDESSTAFEFILTVATTEGAQAGDSTTYNVDFLHLDQAYRVEFYRDDFSTNSRVQGTLRAFDGGREQYVPVYRDDATMDATTMRFSVPREVLVDGNGTAPVAGRAFSLLRATSQGRSNVELGTTRYTDAMPDSGFGATDYEVQMGLRQTGHARLWSDDPVRASNGEEATFVFYVTAGNLREDDDRFDLEASQVPQGWSITLPAATLRVPGNDTQTFPVLVSTAFNHQHGAFERMVLSLTSREDPSAVGRLEVGIRYLEVPQPAGHHDTLWFHSRTEQEDTLCGSIPFCGGPGARSYMNAVEDHDLDEGVPVPPEDSSVGFPDGSEFRWYVFLEPGLQMGMDFDLNRTGTIEVGLDSQVNVQGAVLSGRLVHYRVGDGGRGMEQTVLADLVETSPRDVSGPVLLDTVLVPTRASDLVPYDRSASLVLELTLTGASAAAFEDDVQPVLTEGRVTLPLFEYRDPVEDIFNTLAGLEFRHADVAEKNVNPGETVLFNLTLRNDGAIDDVFELRVNGTNQEWARILGDERVFVGTGHERQVVVAVSPPADAPDGAVMDLVVTAASVAESTVQGNIRVVATVDALIDRTDESFLIEDVENRLTKDRKSPGVGVAGLLGTLAAVAVGTIRRRQTNGTTKLVK